MRVSTAAFAGAFLLVFASTAVCRAAPPPEPALGEPLAYGKDRIEVTTDGCLRGRYRFWGDWEREFQAYLEEARTAARARGTPSRRVTMGCVFLKDATITISDLRGGDGRPLRATYTTPPDFVQAMRGRVMKEYADYMFAFSGGELEVDWVVETVPGLRWAQTGTRNRSWGCQPKAVGDQILRALDAYRDRGVCQWVFCAGRPETVNPTADGKGRKQGIGGPPYGIAYTAWPLHGGYCQVICAPKPDLIVHEFNHRFLDNLHEHEGVRLTSFHGLGRLGFSRTGFPVRLYHATYRYTYQYLIPRDMWRRFTVTGRNDASREPFSGKAYAWEDVRHDCWFKLPELGPADLARLTGIGGLAIAGSRKDGNDWCRAFTVPAGDRDQVRSPYRDPFGEAHPGLDNILVLPRESCAVLRTSTGHWLLVKKELADVYVDMPVPGGGGRGPLPVYGYVNHDLLPLVLIRAPAELPVPSRARDYFGS